MTVCPGQRRPDSMGVKTYLRYFELLNTLSCYCTVVAIWNQFWSFMICFAASEPSSVFAETMSPTILGFFWIISPTCRRCIWIIVSTLRSPIPFDDEFGHGNHSGELLLFVGCFVNFIVSYLICMFQDSVPAGSYNDPFLSSVCVCLKMG